LWKNNLGEVLCKRKEQMNSRYTYNVLNKMSKEVGGEDPFLHRGEAVKIRAAVKWQRRKF